ncbi:hypothetical protein DITRI_Ditri03aG0058800 [Diplodiscus trichospermus]
MIARYGVQLEKGPFERRTADFLWMMIFGALSLLVLSAIPIFQTPFLGICIVFMLLYVWSREFPNAQINIYGLVTLKTLCSYAYYFHNYCSGILSTLGNAGFGCYFRFTSYSRSSRNHCWTSILLLDSVHPLATGKTILKTPMWVHKLVARWRIGAPARPSSSAVAQLDRTTGVAFKGRSYRLNG